MVLKKRGSCFTDIHVCIDTHTQQQSTAVVAIQLMLHIHIETHHARTTTEFHAVVCRHRQCETSLKYLTDGRDGRMDGWTDQFVYHIL